MAESSLVPDGGDGGEAPAEHTWAWAEDLPGEGDQPEWLLGDKYKSVSDQAKAYVDLQKQFGAFSGAPKIEGDQTHGYETENFAPEGIEGFEVPEGDIFVDSFLPLFQGMNMGQANVDELAQRYFAIQSDAIEQETARQNAERTALGANADNRITAVMDYTKAHLNDEESKAIETALTSANAVKAMEKIIAKAKGTRLSDATDPAPAGITAAELAALQTATDPVTGARLMNDPEYAAMVREKRRTLVGDGA